MIALLWPLGVIAVAALCAVLVQRDLTSLRCVSCGRAFPEQRDVNICEWCKGAYDDGCVAKHDPCPAMPEPCPACLGTGEEPSAQVVAGNDFGPVCKVCRGRGMA